MRTLSICGHVRNHRLQQPKLARWVERRALSPDLIDAFERPTAMAWGAVWSCVNHRQGGL